MANFRLPAKIRISLVTLPAQGNFGEENLSFVTIRNEGNTLVDLLGPTFVTLVTVLPRIFLYFFVLQGGMEKERLITFQRAIEDEISTANYKFLLSITCFCCLNRPHCSYNADRSELIFTDT